jgi:hypothetical protein
MAPQHIWAKSENLGLQNWLAYSVKQQLWETWNMMKLPTNLYSQYSDLDTSHLHGNGKEEEQWPLLAD